MNTPAGSLPPASRFNVTADDLRRYDWQKLIAEVSDKDCYAFADIFTKAIAERKAANDDLGQRVYSLLWLLASVWPNLDANGNPYQSMMTWADGRRSLNTDDLVAPDLDALRAIVGEIVDPEFRARVADILWECARDFRAAQSAVQAFLDAAAASKSPDDWVGYTERLDRAARIAARKGFEKEKGSVVAVVEAGIAEYEHKSPPDNLCDRLMGILLLLDAGDSARYAAAAEQMAAASAQAGEWDFAENYWQTATAWHRRAKDAAAVHRCLLEAAETNVSRAKAGLPGRGTNFGYAAHWMGRGLEALRQAKASPERIAEIHRAFLALQKQSLGELETVSLDVDAIPGFRENEEKTQTAATAHVQGRPFGEAIHRFAYITRPTNTVELKEQVRKISERTIFDKVISTAALDHAGKVADTINPASAGAPDDPEILRKKMVRQAADISWPLRVGWYIEPARIAIRAEHPCRKPDFRFLTDSNPFIPPGHEGIFTRGIQAGFFGDWLVAMHLLIPQLEASLRHVLQQAGVVTSTLEADNTQKERDLNQLLWMPEIETVFGADTVFDLRGIMIERFGHNMRNESAHGLMSEGGFYQPAAAYLWWLVIRLCWKGYSMDQRSATPET